MRRLSTASFPSWSRRSEATIRSVWTSTLPPATSCAYSLMRQITSLGTVVQSKLFHAPLPAANKTAILPDSILIL